jgi:hypothetical protein
MLPRCGLRELDGLAALPVLQELYLAFNNISQLSPLTTLEELQARDLENKTEKWAKKRDFNIPARGGASGAIYPAGGREEGAGWG